MDGERWKTGGWKVHGSDASEDTEHNRSIPVPNRGRTMCRVEYKGKWPGKEHRARAMEDTIRRTAQGSREKKEIVCVPDMR